MEEPTLKLVYFPIIGSFWSCELSSDSGGLGWYFVTLHACNGGDFQRDMTFENTVCMNQTTRQLRVSIQVEIKKTAAALCSNCYR